MNEEPQPVPRGVLYLKRSLLLNPLVESERIIRQRSRALGLTTSKRKVGDDQRAQKRARLVEQLDAIRAECWSQPVEGLRTQLKKMELGEFPDLERTGHRLRVILDSRSRLPGLTQHRHFDEKFLKAFKNILSMPARELAIPREQVVASFRKKKLRKRGLKMIALLESNVPELCELERDWLDSLKRQKVRREQMPGSSQPEAVVTESSGSTWWIWILVYLVFKVIIAAMRG